MEMRNTESRNAESASPEVSPSPNLPLSLSSAYTTASQGQGSVFVPLRAVFDQMRIADPALTQEAFAAEIKRAYDANELYLEGANSQQEAADSGLAIEGTPVGTAVRVAFPQTH